MKRYRLWSALLTLGAIVLLTRCTLMLTGGSLKNLKWWVNAMLFAEMAVDVATIAGAIRWYATGVDSHASVPLRAGAAAAILHAIRVLVFVLGRTPPFLNFDVRPEYIADHAERWSWFWVYFAATLSVLGVVGVVVIWAFRRRFEKNRRRGTEGSANGES